MNGKPIKSERLEVMNLPASQTLTGVDQTPETKTMDTNIDEPKEKSIEVQVANVQSQPNIAPAVEGSTALEHALNALTVSEYRIQQEDIDWIIQHPAQALDAKDKEARPILDALAELYGDDRTAFNREFRERLYGKTQKFDRLLRLVSRIHSKLKSVEDLDDKPAQPAQHGQQLMPWHPRGDEPPWMQTLPRNKEGSLKPTVRVFSEILRHDYQDRLSYNELTREHLLDGRLANNEDLIRLREEIETKRHVAATPQVMLDSFNHVAFERKFHPVRDYLDRLPEWDGVRRWEQLPQKVLFSSGKLDTVYLRKWAVSAIARIMEPGCKVDTLLNLCGVQGVGKSSFFRVLAGKWFIDSPLNMNNAHWVQEVHRAWILELQELETITGKREAGEVKAWLSRRDDIYKMPYATKVETWPRQFVAVGTTNKREILVDSTGNRRFLFIEVGGKIDLELTQQWRDQLWAEALFNYQQGEAWYLTQEQEEQQRELNKQYEEHEVWTEAIEKWLRRNTRECYSVTDILTGALQIEVPKMTKGDRNRATNAMRELGWDYRQKKIGGKNERVFVEVAKPTQQELPENIDTQTTTPKVQDAEEWIP